MSAAKAVVLTTAAAAALMRSLTLTIASTFPRRRSRADSGAAIVEQVEVRQQMFKRVLTLTLNHNRYQETRLGVPGICAAAAIDGARRIKQARRPAAAARKRIKRLLTFVARTQSRNYEANQSASSSSSPM